MCPCQWDIPKSQWHLLLLLQSLPASEFQAHDLLVVLLNFAAWNRHTPAGKVATTRRGLDIKLFQVFL